MRSTARAVRERAERLQADRVPFVHARVVLAERPTSAKPGDEAIVLADGTIEGFVGGQCAVATVRSQGLAALQRGEAVLVRIAPMPEPDQPGKTVVHNPCQSGGTLEIFMEPVLPAPLVGVLGASPIARALVTVGNALGYDVRAWDDDAPDLTVVDAVVAASHGEGEVSVLETAVRAGVPYVGLVASRKRGAAVLASLDLDDAAKARIHTPAGLDIKARTPEEVALSILAEIIATRGADPADAAPAEPTPIAIDPVCHMSVATVPTSISAEVDGETYWFCVAGCRDRFVADPARFLDA